MEILSGDAREILIEMKTKQKQRVLFHTDVILHQEKFNIAIHEDPEAGWLMNVRPDVPGSVVESIAMAFWRTMGTGDGWKTAKEAKKDIEKAIKKSIVSPKGWSGWHREVYG